MTVPEIKRVNLSSTILTLKSLGIMDVVDFDYLDRPEVSSIHYALKQLFMLSAISQDGTLLPLGHELSMFPLEPCFGVSLLASHYLGCELDLSALVSVLSSENVWLAHSRKDNVGEEQLVDIRRRFGRGTDQKSDHMLIVNMFNEWAKNHLRNEGQWCWKNRLQSRALKQAKNIQEQIMDHMKQVNWDKLEDGVPEFRALRKEVKREIRKELEASK